MLTMIVTQIVASCCRHAKFVGVLAIIVAGLAGTYAVKSFSISTDSSKLIAEDLPWRKRQSALTSAFPQNEDLILVVVDGDTPEAAEGAAAALVDCLKTDTTHFKFVKLPAEEAFYARTGLLFQPLDTLTSTLDDLTKSEPLIATLSIDPSLRGLMSVIAQVSIGVEHGKTSVNAVQNFLGKVDNSLEAALAGRLKRFSFEDLIDQGALPLGTRRFVQIKARLDYARLEPGEEAAGAVEHAVKDLGLTPDHGVSVRMTGQIPLDDQEFGTVKQGFALNLILTVLTVVVILWFALRSARLVIAVVLSTAFGLILTTAAGLAAVGALNLISIAFAVLFIGIGVDFGIQFSVRYRDERFAQLELIPAITATGAKAGRPLMLAAAATAAGFYSFLPTDYKGVSELGLIAGNGMIIAFLTSITLLPALITLLRPPSEGREVGYKALAPLDNFLARQRLWVIGGTFGLTLVLSPMLSRVRFDFNLLNLSSPTLESVATLTDLRNNRATTPDRIEILAPSVETARSLAGRLDPVPEVGGTTTLSSFVPNDQPPKLDAIKAADAVLGPVLQPEEKQPTPDDADDVAAMQMAVRRLGRALQKVADPAGPGARVAQRLAEDIDKLAAAPGTARRTADEAFVPAMKILIAQLTALLGVGPVTQDDLPEDLQRNWVTPQGVARVEVTPKALDGSNATIAAFSAAVLKVAPDAAGQPVILQESGRSVVWAFIEAGILALASIAALLYLVLRRIVDVLLTLVPLIMAGVLTMEITALIDLPFNFANIIALPLLLGLGVAFKIYFVMAWRAGQTHLLQSSLTRAVFFSAMATAVAFGSLWLSNHPGTSSMGKLLTLSLACTLIAAVFFQPALMGPPRKRASPKTASPPLIRRKRAEPTARQGLP